MWAVGLKLQCRKSLGLFSKTSQLLGNDWTKISFDFFEVYAIPIPTPGGGTDATMFSTQFNDIAKGMHDLLASTQHDKLEQERAKDIIDTTHTDFPADVKAVYKKVANKKWLRKSDHEV